MLLHICGVDDWRDAEGDYRPPGFETDGFIHLSRADQVLRPANRFYAGRDDLVLLVIDERRVHGELRWEPSAVPEEAGERFPHLYGSVPVEAVVDQVAFPPGPDGLFALPPGVAHLLHGG